MSDLEGGTENHSGPPTSPASIPSSRFSIIRPTGMDAPAWALGASAVAVAIGRASLVLPLVEGASRAKSLTLRATAAVMGVNAGLALLCVGFGLHCFAETRFFSKAVPAALALSAVIPVIAALVQTVCILVYAMRGGHLEAPVMRAYATGVLFIVLVLQIVFMAANWKLGFWNPVKGIMDSMQGGEYGTESVNDGEEEDGYHVLKQYKREIEMVFVTDVVPAASAVATSVLVCLMPAMKIIDGIGCVVQLAGLALNIRSIRRALAFRLDIKTRSGLTTIPEEPGADTTPLIDESSAV